MCYMNSGYSKAVDGKFKVLHSLSNRKVTSKTHSLIAPASEKLVTKEHVKDLLDRRIVGS